MESLSLNTLKDNVYCITLQDSSYIMQALNNF